MDVHARLGVRPASDARGLNSAPATIPARHSEPTRRAPWISTTWWRRGGPAGSRGARSSSAEPPWVGAAAAALGPGAARPAAGQATQRRELVVGQGGDVSKLDPHFSTSSNDIRVTFNLFDNLTRRHPDDSLHPGLATEWKATAPTTWTFRLRSGVRFHNGDPFTSADAKFSIERTYDPSLKTLVASVFTTIDRIEAPDPGTLVIHTKKPDPLLPARLAFYGGQIVPKRHL